ncbi:unnamed protein product [Aphanomyces euteiches]|uniref:Inward rectifier potassium channel C-terminal domain-containing protein n=1 Tax=Aphanomyces euteiches TaxID=100861 RepID=A0A6G0W949_9STRA|nr:hypothetical protein Ae201684_017700 [Aphanomyces euteiches]KAH9150959.1 hypothetical protein AeRB84_006319 [Aphanomyces euteiches]
MTSQAFRKPIRGINAKPRALYKDLVYILLNLTWIRLTLVLVAFYFGVTLIFAILFDYVCEEPDSFSDTFHYSYQAFSTIGFGIVYPRTRCGNYVLVTELLVSMLAIPAMTGLVFSKFSLNQVKLAVSRIGVLHRGYKPNIDALIFRVANASYARNLHQDLLLNVSVSLELFCVEATDPARPPVLRRYRLALQQSDLIMLRLAMHVVHIVDTSSPLHRLLNSSNANFTVQLTVQGVESNRHATVVDQRLYSSQDILDGYTFDPMVYPQANDNWEIDFSRLNAVSAIVPEAVPSPATTSVAATHEIHAIHMHNASFRRSNSEPRKPPTLNRLESQFLAHAQPLIRLGDLEEEYAISRAGLIPSTKIHATNPPHVFQYVYHHLLHMKWVVILVGLVTIVLAFALFFGSLHCIKYHSGLYVATDLEQVLSPFELSFFLSMHTLSTVGLGDVAPANHDHFHNALVVLEAIVGISLMAIVTGLAWSKFALPQAHIQFSSSLLATHVHGQPCLVFRAVNTRHMGDIAACEFKLGALFEDRHGQRTMHDLPLVQPMWPSLNIPVTLVHVIDSASPLARYSLDELNHARLLILAVVSGFDTTFCETVFARQMYTEFERDQVFDDVVHLTSSGFTIDWDKIHSTPL